MSVKKYKFSTVLKDIKSLKSRVVDNELVFDDQKPLSANRAQVQKATTLMNKVNRGLRDDVKTFAKKEYVNNIDPAFKKQGGLSMFKKAQKLGLEMLKKRGQMSSSDTPKADKNDAKSKSDLANQNK